ncbi:hypothetical protein ACA910_010323 [Epithemia clementina (nom. ined.)]
MGNADSKGGNMNASDVAMIDPAMGADSGVDGYGDSNGFEEKKEDHYTHLKNNRKNSKNGRSDRRMANGKDIWNSLDGDGEPNLAPEDQVHVNLAMADLMAYLQVVANNSNHLPLTRRDDPELDRSVSQLTPEDYARKSAAFVPADVRVIGGVFTRYGRVWDLPTSQEYNASDGAHEPGRSYGGACANALLKVVYDAASEVADVAQNDAAAASLFEDDDDFDGDNFSITQKSVKSGFSLDCTQPNPTTISWAELLRKMKAEMKEIEYAQYPKITTTRKIDLSKPFSLVPEDFDFGTGQKRALLIGCNYSHMEDASLKASHDDVRSMKDYIVNVHGFSESEDLMTVLLDDGEHKHPTFRNITESFKALSEEAQPGDAVFVQFSGHGGRILDTDVEDSSYDEVIVPSDYTQSGLIRDTLIFKTLLAPMRYGVTVTIVMDCCDNGMLVELPYAWSTKSDRQQRDSVPKLAINEDFSFVRFLKVVKTLYESSTFTQLGKTVGHALNGENEDEFGPETDFESVHDKETAMDVSQDKSLFEIFAKACSMSSKAEKRRKNGMMTPKENMFDQLLNSCSVFAPDEGEITDEDTLRTDTEGGYSYDETTAHEGHNRSFDSITDEESVDRRGRRNHRTRRK